MLAVAHFTTGCATAITLCQPKKLTDIISVGLIGGLAGMWPDCDLGNSKISKQANNAMKILLPLLIFAVLVAHEGINIYDMKRFITFFGGISVFIAFTVASRTRPHREFTHSLVCAIGLFIASKFIIEEYAMAVLVGLLSHIVLDILNTKGVIVFFPFKKGFKLGLCKSNGIVNQIIPVVCIIYISISVIVKIM